MEHHWILEDVEQHSPGAEFAEFMWWCDICGVWQRTFDKINTPSRMFIEECSGE